MTAIAHSVLLVGSVPLPTVEDVFRACAGTFGPSCRAYPDGEVGARRNWVFYLPERTYSSHADLVPVNVPASKQVAQPDRDVGKDEFDGSFWTFRLRDGVTELDLGSLGYAKEARRSYAVFTRLREEGVIPAQARFQVCLPTTGPAVMGFFARPEEWPVIYEAYRRAIRNEVAEIVDAIPHADLVIQWDTANELKDILAGDEPLYAWSPKTSGEEKTERHFGDMDALAGVVPDDVMLGYHFCFGTWGDGQDPVRRTSGSACGWRTKRPRAQAGASTTSTFR